MERQVNLDSAMDHERLGQMASDLGANGFSFSGEALELCLCEGGGPMLADQAGWVLDYRGPEGHHIYTGQELMVEPSALGTLISVTVRPDVGAGELLLTIVIPHICGVKTGAPVTFATIAIRTRTRGNMTSPGPDARYIPILLTGEAWQVSLPLKGAAWGRS